MMIIRHKQELYSKEKYHYKRLQSMRSIFKYIQKEGKLISLCIIYLYESRGSDEIIWTFASSQDGVTGTGFILPLK